MSLLEMEHVNVSYGAIQVLWDISLDLEESEIVSIIGSNGAGKSTVLKTIIGVLRPTSGNIKFNEEKIDKLPPHLVTQKGIILVPEGRRVFDTLSVLENLDLGAAAKESRKQKDKNLKWIFDLFPILKERQNQLASTLSGGERQMLAIARGLMGMPKLLMLDEPSLGLSPRIVIKLYETVKEINKEGVAILLVEQNVPKALDVSRRAYVLETGRITLTGSREELFKNEHVKDAYLGL